MPYFSLAATQDDYPNRMIKIVVPLPAGGMPDVVTRIVAEKLAAKWGQPVVIENRPGAALSLGAEAVANAPPDGYTLLSTPPGPLVTNQYLYSNLRFDPDAFAPISVVVKLPFILVIHPKTPASNLRDLIAYAKANPNKLNFPSSGFGSPPHLVGELLQAKARDSFHPRALQGLGASASGLARRASRPHVSCAGRHAPAYQDRQPEGTRGRWPGTHSRVAGRSGDFGSAARIRRHRLVCGRCSAENSIRRISAKLSQAVAEIVRLPDVSKQLRDFALAPVGASPAETAEFLKQERERWRDVIVTAGIKPR